jgi:hypothetical protein
MHAVNTHIIDEATDALYDWVAQSLVDNAIKKAQATSVFDEPKTNTNAKETHYIFD